MIYRIILISFVFFWSRDVLAQLDTSIENGPRFSIEAEEGFSPCLDTIKAFFFKTTVDLDLMLPAWLPVVDYEHIAVLEGKVIPRPGSKHKDNHITQIDFPPHHYTHDVTFEVKPDRTPDNRFTNLLANRIIRKIENGEEIIDTVLKEYVHVEWESGLGAGNQGNPCEPYNIKGNSCGFFSQGHEKGDVIWNWPSPGDWVHVEGLWIWDRGHPPAKTEIHPARLVAFKRNLPVSIKTPEGRSVFATRIDVFASGDGGALNNNRKGMPEFVQRVKMGDKDYSFEVSHTLPKPSSNCILKYLVKTQKGDSYSGNFEVIPSQDSTSLNTGPFLKLNIPWKTLPDTMVFARTVYAYWDGGNGIASHYPIHAYKVVFEAIKFKKRKEFISRSEFRLFLESGGDWLFYNDFTDDKDILNQGIGKTFRRKWNLSREFVIYVPEGKKFRVFAGGWEADGLDRSYGKLLDPYSPCNKEFKTAVNSTLRAASPFKLHGCIDDPIGEVQEIHDHFDIGMGKSYEVISDGRREEDFCPCDNGKQYGVFKLRYRIERID